MCHTKASRALEPPQHRRISIDRLPDQVVSELRFEVLVIQRRIGGRTARTTQIQQDMVILRDGKETAGVDVQEDSSERPCDATTRGDEMEDRVAGLEAQMTEVKAMLQLLVGCTVQNSPSQAAPENVSPRAPELEFQQAPAHVPNL